VTNEENTPKNQEELPPPSIQNNTITGFVIDDPVVGAEVYIDFGDSNSTKAITATDGSYKLVLSDEDLAKINPEIPEGADAPRDNLLLVAQKDGRVLRNALSRDVSNGQEVYVTNDTEAYAQYLESIGKFDTVTLTEFNTELEKGRIKDSSDKAAFIKDIREDVKTYFYGGTKPTASVLFAKALTHLGKDKVATLADDSSYISTRSVVSGGDIYIVGDVNVSSDDVSISNKGNGRYTIGTGSDSSKTAYLSIQSSEGYKLVPLDIKEKTVTQVASQNVTPQNGATLGSVAQSVQATIPPFALNEATDITINKIDTNGESIDGRPLLDMQPSGLTFEMPITLSINYGDFGIDDPNALKWQYGSADEGYSDAEIVSIDTTNKIINLSVSHFSSLLVRSIGEQTFLDLGWNFVNIAPARLSPQTSSYNDNSLIQDGSKRIITNKLFTNDSISNRKGRGSLLGSANNGQCVQSARNFFLTIMNGEDRTRANMQALTAHGVKGVVDEIREDFYANNNTLPQYVRARADDCQYGDVVYIDTSIQTGHTAIYSQRTDDGNFTVIESNYNDKEQIKISGKYTQKYAYEQSNNSFNWSQYKQNKYLCVSKEYFNTNNATNAIINYKTVLNSGGIEGQFGTPGFSNITETPWKYFLVDVEKSKAFNPKLLPVTPLKIDFNDTTGVGRILSKKDARYEIYADASISSASMSNGNTLEKNSSKSLKFDGNDLSLMYVETDSGRIVEQPMMSDGNIWHTVTSSQKGKMLFSPTVIDDYYIDWGSVDPLVGFKNSKTYNLDFAGDYTTTTTLEANKIYRTEEALNGYFMTLGNEDSGVAKWFFALAGYHTIFINIPTGKVSDVQNATYTLYLGDEEVALELADLNATKKGESDFKNWYPLRAKGDKRASFNLTGKDRVTVKATSGTIAVDAIRLDTADQEEFIVEANIKADLSNTADHAQYMCKLDISSLTSSIQKEIPLGTTFKLKLNKPLNRDINLKFNYQVVPQTGVWNWQQGNGGYSTRVSSRSSSESATTYKPQTQYITIPAGTTNINLPSVTLYKNLKKDSVNLKAIDATTGAKLSDVNVTVRFGMDRDDNTTAYSGVTDSNGIFSISDVPYGQYSVSLSKNGYIATSLNLSVDDDTPSSTDLSLSPVLADGEMRIRLTWGENPSDLDSHLVKKIGSTTEYHIYYADKIGTNGDNLDWDDTSSFGPETTSVRSLDNSAVYTYYVHHYSGSGSIKESGASVKISSGDTERTVYPPMEDGRYWKVFTIENGEIKVCTTDCIADSSTSMVSASSSSSYYQRDDMSVNYSDILFFRNLPPKE